MNNRMNHKIHKMWRFLGNSQQLHIACWIFLVRVFTKCFLIFSVLIFFRFFFVKLGIIFLLLLSLSFESLTNIVKLSLNISLHFDSIHDPVAKKMQFGSFQIILLIYSRFFVEKQREV